LTGAEKNTAFVQQVRITFTICACLKQLTKQATKTFTKPCACLKKNFVFLGHD
jgi:hypothetical protein